jgi:hypothetical protein
MHAIRVRMAEAEILDRSTSDFPQAWAFRHSRRVADGLADAADVDSKATLGRRVEQLHAALSHFKTLLT